LRAVNSHQL